MKIYISDIRPYIGLSEIGAVTESRQARINKLRNPADKAHCLATGLLLRRHCGIENDSQIIYNENGKPCLKDGNLRFNAAHSGNYAVLGVSDAEIGIDIEKIKPYKRNVAARCFTPPELEWLRQNGDNAFFRLWTAKESIMKATGLGLAKLPPNTFTVLPAHSPVYLLGKYWNLKWFEHDGHVICTATALD